MLVGVFLTFEYLGALTKSQQPLHVIAERDESLTFHSHHLAAHAFKSRCVYLCSHLLRRDKGFFVLCLFKQNAAFKGG